MRTPLALTLSLFLIVLVAGCSHQPVDSCDAHIDEMTKVINGSYGLGICSSDGTPASLADCMPAYRGGADLDLLPTADLTPNTSIMDIHCTTTNQNGTIRCAGVFLNTAIKESPDKYAIVAFLDNTPRLNSPGLDVFRVQVINLSCDHRRMID